jgi:hypothetical protein
MSHQHGSCDSANQVIGYLAEIREWMLTRRMLHETRLGPILASFVVPIENAVGPDRARR